MKLSIDFKHCHSTPGIKNFIGQKSKALQKYLHSDGALHWMVSAQKDQYVVHVHLTAAHGDYFSEASEHQVHSALAAATKKIEAQLKKKKAMARSQLHKRRSMEVPWRALA